MLVAWFGVWELWSFEVSSQNAHGPRLHPVLPLQRPGFTRSIGVAVPSLQVNSSRVGPSPSTPQQTETASLAGSNLGSAPEWSSCTMGGSSAYPLSTQPLAGPSFQAPSPNPGQYIRNLKALYVLGFLESSSASRGHCLYH